MTGLYNGHEDTFFEWYMVGKTTGRVIRDAECTPYMEALYANVRLTYPSYRFDTAPMPIPNSTVFFARNYNAFSSAFRGVFPAPMNFLLHNGSIPPEADPTRIDPFFRALIWGPDGIRISEFSDPSKINTTLIPGIERLRARQLAQLLSGTPTAAPTPQKAPCSTTTQTARPRRTCTTSSPT
ncbi:hypothetical protein BFW01_g1211 [Lasiodiplodia theobromae]|uniref:Uncharacterized protein n=1 Tax=Lasiodiplodia theobromae TaxID=45133 RepID=A0A8H7IS50_9PEZI|nr:hypothetical protein BFW01_g1211 [Lasiodiplodia theobromae]